ncbi:MAG: serine/threonine-protein kinase [Polyangiaceae bacterium]
MSEKWEYRPGTLIPGTKYQVVQKLGAGGMGTVYEVEDVSVERRFVLKTIHVKYAAHQVAVDRFVREAKALGKLEHKNIVQVMTAGVTGDALQLRYFVMEKLTGHSLRTVIDSKGALPLSAACLFMIELMGALNCAHDAGIVHRDIKPENIFIARDSSGVTTLKLLDFGIMTSTGTRTVDRKGFMGTARYSSPEQMSEGHDATPQSDLYSATLVFYELVCGIGPFDDLYEIPELMEAHRVRPPPPPSKFRRGIPTSLEDLILRGLAKKPEDRQADAFSYAEEVSRILQELRSSSGSNAVAAPPTPRVAPPPATTLDASFAPAPPPAPLDPPETRNRPIISMTDIDQQAAQDFARVSSPRISSPRLSREKLDEPGTMGATHSTMPGLPTNKNRAWIFVGVAALLIAGGAFATMKSRSNASPKGSATESAPPPATIPQATAQSPSAGLPAETAPIVIGNPSPGVNPSPSANASASSATSAQIKTPSSSPAKNKSPKPAGSKDDVPWQTTRLPGSGL